MGAEGKVAYDVWRHENQQPICKMGWMSLSFED